MSSRNITFSEWTMVAENSAPPTITYDHEDAIDDEEEGDFAELTINIFTPVDGDNREMTYTYESTVTMETPEQNFILTWAFAGRTGKDDPSISVEIISTNASGMATTQSLVQGMDDNMGHTDDGNADFYRFIAVTLFNNQNIKIVFKLTPGEEVTGTAPTVRTWLQDRDDAEQVVETMQEGADGLSPEDFVEAVQELRQFDVAFIEFWNSEQTVSNMFPAGKEQLKKDMGAFVRTMHLTPNSVRNIIIEEAEQADEDLKDKLEVIRNEKIAAGTSSTIAGLTSWIPYVGAAIATIDIGVSVFLLADADKRLRALEALVGGAVDASQWLSSQPDVANGLNLYYDLALSITRREDSDLTVDIVIRKNAEQLLWYLQGLVALGIEDISPEEIEEDLNSIGPENEIAFDYATFIQAYGQQDHAGEDGLETRERIQVSLSAFNILAGTASLQRVSPILLRKVKSLGYFGFSKGKALLKTWFARFELPTGISRASGPTNLRCARNIRLYGNLANIDYDANTGFDVDTFDEADDIARRGDPKLSPLQQIRKASFLQQTRGTKFMTVLEGALGIVEVGLAIAQFNEMEEVIDEITTARKDFANELKDFWLPDDFEPTEDDFNPENAK